MNSKYQTIKYRGNKASKVNDLVSIEEPLEMSVRYKKNKKWIHDSISITMRTPKNDEDLITGLLFCEGIISKKSEIEKIEFLGDKVGKFKIQNKIQITLGDGENLNIKHLRRNFLTNRVNNYWNSLSELTRDASNINEFKNGIDRELSNIMYDYEV